MPEDQVDTPSVSYEAMAVKYPMLQALANGTQAMRDAGEMWLPRMPKEMETAYTLRLGRSILYGMYADTLERLTAKPFAREVTMQGELPSKLEGLLENVDKSGTNLTQFGRDAFKSALQYGKVHALVDFTQMPAGATLEDEKTLGARPAWILVDAPQLIGWLTESGEDGIPQLSQVRIFQTKVEPAGKFIDETVEYIRVYGVNTWEVWRKGEDDEEYVKFDEGEHTFGSVPLFTLYFNRTGFLTSNPPLEDLAWLNIAHWQSDSDQRTLLQIARVGILFSQGFDKDEIDKGLTLGPNHLVSTEAKPGESALTFVEHSGQAISAGRQDLLDIEQRAEVLGLKPLIERSSGATATGKIIDENSQDTTIQTWIRAEETWIRDLAQASGQWVDQDIDVSFDIFNEFGIKSGDVSVLSVLLQAVIVGKISHETFLKEYKRRAVLSDNMDIAEEIERINTGEPDAVGE